MPYIRLKDIAEHAGVSINTVSRALKDKPDIGEETKQRIRKIADELGYIPHANASGLRSNRTKTIGVIITHFNNAFYSRILQGIHDAIGDSGYSILTMSSNEDMVREKELFVSLVSNRVAGMIFVPSQDIVNQIAYDAINVPHITIVRKGNQNTQDYFIIDSHKSGTLAAEHFLSQKRRLPAYIGYELPVSCNKARLDGFYQTLNEGGVELDRQRISLCNSNAESAYTAAGTLLDRVSGIDSLFVYNDQMAFGVLRALKDRGVTVPKDITVLGHDDIEDSRFFNPSLSTIHVSKYRLGYESAECLLEKIETSEYESKSVIYNPELIVRES